VAPRIYRTEEWGARLPEQYFDSRPAHGIVIHHTGTPGDGDNRTPLRGDDELAYAFALARGIQDFHMFDVKHGWQDTGQHFTVSRGGVVLEGRWGSLAAAQRGQVVTGAHAGDLEGNLHWWGIEIEGNYLHDTNVPAAEWSAVTSLCDWLLARGRLSTAQIKPHHLFNSGTPCPGHLEDRIPALSRALAVRRAGRAFGAFSAAAVAMVVARRARTNL